MVGQHVHIRIMTLDARNVVSHGFTHYTMPTIPCLEQVSMGIARSSRESSGESEIKKRSLNNHEMNKTNYIEDRRTS